MTQILHTTGNSYVIDDDMDHWIPLNKIDPMMLDVMIKKSARIKRLENRIKWLAWSLVAAFFGLAKILQVYEHCNRCL
jgi:hypothetical protein